MAGVTPSFLLFLVVCVVVCVIIDTSKGHRPKGHTMNEHTYTAANAKSIRATIERNEVIIRRGIFTLPVEEINKRKAQNERLWAELERMGAM